MAKKEDGTSLNIPSSRFHRNGGGVRRESGGAQQEAVRRGAAEFSDRIAIGSYSLVGTRGDVDFLL